MSPIADRISGYSDRRLKILASSSGLSLERLKSLAAGSEPSMAELRLLSTALKAPLADLLPTDDSRAEKAGMLFRRSGTRDPGSISHQLARKVSSASALVRIPSSIASWQRLFRPAEDTLASAELNAALFRKHFFNDDQLSPITALPRIASDAMKVFVYVIKSAEIDGASAVVDGIPYAFVSERFSGRMLFTLAHEIGHLVAHHIDGGDFGVVDEDLEASHSHSDSKDEAYANAFASALLMPAGSVGVALQTIRRVTKSSGEQIGDIEIGYLARIYGLSFWAAARRCEDLQLIPTGGAHALNQQLVEEFGSAEKRGDQVGLPLRAQVDFPKVPTQLLANAVSGIRNGDISIGKAASLLGVSLGDLFTANTTPVH